MHRALKHLTRLFVNMYVYNLRIARYTFMYLTQEDSDSDVYLILNKAVIRVDSRRRFAVKQMNEMNVFEQ